MAYDAAKAHEYYINYKKKGLKKGRKKGKGKTKTSTMSLLGVSISGLNDEGKIQGALIKEKLKKEMNEALKKATTDEEKEKIRIEYSRKAVQQLAALKSDAKYAKAKATKSSSSKSSKSTGGSSRSSSSKNTSTSKELKKTQETVAELTNQVNELKSMIGTLTDSQKEMVATTIETMIEKLLALQGIDLTKVKKTDGKTTTYNGSSLLDYLQSLKKGVNDG